MSQHMDALKRANEYRIAVAQVKREIAAESYYAGCAAVAEIAAAQAAGTLPDYLGSAKVAQMLAWPRQMGVTAPRRLAAQAPRVASSGDLRVRDLTCREALVIAAHYGRLANGAMPPQRKEPTWGLS